METITNAFPEYTPKWVKLGNNKWELQNIFRSVDLGHGGYVYAEPGVYTNVALLDSASHHPHSLILMNYFGEHTKTYEDILNIRLAIKHGEFEKARHMFGGRLAKYLDDPAKAEQLSQALKIAANSTYGVTAAKYQNPMTHPDNKNNIIALRGAIFLKMLQDEVNARGFKVVAVRTDSIKIPNASPEIIQFVMDFGHKYGYDFEFECMYDRMCLVNQSTYVAKFATPEQCEALHGFVPGKNVKKGGKWEAVAAQFAHPVVFKTLFSKEPLDFWDYGETKEVKGKMFLDFNEDLPDVTMYEVERDERRKEAAGQKTRVNRPYRDLNDAALDSEIAKGHSYHFVGKVGLFTPVKNGFGGGELLVYRNDSYSAVTGTKGFRWLESETLRNANMEDMIDMTYYRGLIDDAKDAISQYCDFSWFVSNDPAPQELLDFGHPPEDNVVPWFMPCKDPTKNICEECPEFEYCPYLAKEREQANVS